MQFIFNNAGANNAQPQSLEPTKFSSRWGVFGACFFLFFKPISRGPKRFVFMEGFMYIYIYFPSSITRIFM